MKTILFLILIFAISCSPAPEKYTETISDSKSTDAEPPCDDEEAAKVEVSEEGVNLLQEDEGCKLEE